MVIDGLTLGLGWRRPIVIVQQDTVGGPLQIVELAGSNSPEECGYDQCHQHDRHRNQQVEDVHPAASRAQSFTPRPRRRLLATTSRELADMPMAAIHGATKPAAAAGMASRL